MSLPARIRKEPKRASRWRSTVHRDFIRGFACCNCGSDTNIQVAHVRIGSGAGIGQKPDDWRTAPLCGGETGFNGCHAEQHRVGEPAFWARYKHVKNQTVEQLIAEFIEASPKRNEIKAIMRERENA